MSKRLLSRIGYGLLALSAVIYIAQLVFLWLTPANAWSRRAFFFPFDPTDLSLLTFAVVGAVIISRRPQNAVGWLFLVVGLCWECFGLAQAYASFLLIDRPSAFRLNDPVLVLLGGFWVVAFGLAPLLLFIFPDGRIASRWGRLALALYALVILASYLTVSTGFNAGPTNINLTSILGLVGVPGSQALADQIPIMGGMGSMGLIVIGAIRLGLRLRRARGVERAQLEWFALAGIFFMVIVVGTSVFFDQLHSLDPGALYSADLFYGIPYAIAMAAVSLAVGVAILRYHLYDIDVIIRRTLIYGLLTVILALLFNLSSIAGQQLFSGITGQSSELATIVSTLAIAALFSPLRRRIQEFIDRRFYRKKYDAQKVLAAFGATVRDEVELNRLTNELLSVVEETMQPASASLWLRKVER